MKILLIDSTSRGESILRKFEEFQKTRTDICLLCFYGSRIKRRDKGEWFETEEKDLVDIDLRIRHKNEKVSHEIASFPKAEKQICLGGDYGGVVTDKSEQYGFEYDVPIAVPNKISQNVFTTEWAKQLIDWIQDDSKFPEFLNKRTFNVSLEEILRQKNLK